MGNEQSNTRSSEENSSRNGKTTYRSRSGKTSHRQDRRQHTESRSHRNNRTRARIEELPRSGRSPSPATPIRNVPAPRDVFRPKNDLPHWKYTVEFKNHYYIVKKHRLEVFVSEKFPGFTHGQRNFKLGRPGGHIVSWFVWSSTPFDEAVWDDAIKYGALALRDDSQKQKQARRDDIKRQVIQSREWKADT